MVEEVGGTWYRIEGGTAQLALESPYENIEVFLFFQHESQD